MKIEEMDLYLRTIQRTLLGKSKELFPRYNLTHPRFLAMLIIKRNQPVSMGEITRQIQLASSTVTSLMNGLQQTGYIIRKRDTNDRRVVRISISPAGEECLRGLLFHRIRYLEEAVAQLEKEKKIALFEGIEALYEEICRQE